MEFRAAGLCEADYRWPLRGWLQVDSARLATDGPIAGLSEAGYSWPVRLAWREPSLRAYVRI